MSPARPPCPISAETTNSGSASQSRSLPWPGMFDLQTARAAPALKASAPDRPSIAAAA